MKKVVYTLALEGYPNEMTDLTFPWIEHYANKIGASFFVIKKQKFPDWPPTFEKHQIWQLGKNVDWNIFIDADALINPELFDVTAVVPKDTVVFTGQDMAAMRFRPNKYMLRDGRYIGACSWFVVSSDWTHDLWRPPTEDGATIEQLKKNIFPTNGERQCRVGDGSHGISAEKLIEDYTLSSNIARFGLKHTTIEGHIKQRFGRMYDAYYWHQYTITIDEKIIQCLNVMKAWGLVTPAIEEKFGSYIKKLEAQPLGQPGPQMPMRPPC
jgi:hypothetical protein